MPESRQHWAAMWRSKTATEGKVRFLMYGEERLPVLFRTRREAREWIKEEYGYIATRRDLRDEPHGWRMPVPVRVRVTIQVTETDA